MCNQYVAGGVAVGTAVTGVVLLAVSFSTLHATEWGLNYDAVFESISPTVYDAGLHCIGPGHSFIRFPNTYQNMAFSTTDDDLLHTRTSDGLPLTLGVSFQYTLIRSRLYDLYMNYRDDYRRVLFNSATHIIANSAANYTAYAFFSDKQTISYAMQRALNEYVSEHLFLQVETLQILLVQLPAAFEEAILESIAVKQNITRTEKSMQNALVQFQTQVLAATQAANQTVALAHGAAQQILAQQTAEAAVVTQNVAAEVEAYARVQQSLDLSPADLVQYVWWDAVASDTALQEAQMLVGVNPAAYINQNANANANSNAGASASAAPAPASAEPVRP